MTDLLRTSEIQVASEPFIFRTEIDNFCLIQRPTFSDYRGTFRENFRIADCEEFLGCEIKIAQNQTSSSLPNVLRGIHAEDQIKLITPKGRVLAVIVDLRPDSVTFKRWVMVDVDNSEKSLRKTTLCVGGGNGNSFYVYPDSGIVDYDYSVTGSYDPANARRGVKWNDKTLAIPWAVKNPIISDRDNSLSSLEEFVGRYFDLTK